MLPSSHRKRERSKTHWPEGSETDAEITFFFFFKLSSLTLATWLGDDAPPDKMQNTRELHFLLKNLQFSLGLPYMSPDYLCRLNYQLRYAQNEVTGEKAYCPGKGLLLLHSTARLHVGNIVWDGSDLACPYKQGITVWVHNHSSLD